MNRLSVTEKAFYNKSRGIDLKLMEFPAVEEFLYWTNRGIDPRSSTVALEWSGDGLVWFALEIYFSENRPLSDAIDYLDKYIM